MTYVAGRRGAALADEPPSECAGYRAFDARLQGFVVAAMLRLMLEAGRPMDACLSKLRASTLTNLVLSFRSCAKFDDAFARRLVTSLPRTIEHVRLELVNSSATSVGGRAILDGLMTGLELPNVKVLKLNDCLLVGCIPRAVGACTSLDTLVLAGIEMDGPLSQELGQCVALRIARLQNNRFTGDIPAAIGNCHRLEELRLHGNPRQFNRGTCAMHHAANATCQPQHALENIPKMERSRERAPTRRAHVSVSLLGRSARLPTAPVNATRRRASPLLPLVSLAHVACNG